MKNTNQRIEWIDALKGFAILMVVIGHLAAKCDILKWIILFHMDLFFVLCGMTASLSITRYAEIGIFFKKHCICLLLPYLCWNFIELPFFTEAVKHYDIIDRLHICLTGRISHGGRYWFLICLLALQAIFCLYIYLTRKYRIATWLKWCCFLGMLIFITLLHRCIGRTKPDYDNLSRIELVTQMYHYIVPFAVGVTIVQYERVKNILFSRTSLGLCVFIVLFVPFCLHAGIFYHICRVYGVAISLVLLVIFQRINSSTTYWWKWLKLCGTNSLVIYLFHFAFISSSQAAELISKFACNPLEQFVCFTLISIPVMYACIMLKKIINVSPLFSLLLLGTMTKANSNLSDK